MHTTVSLLVCTNCYLCVVPLQCLYNDHCGRQPNTPAADLLTVGQLNSYLDELARAEGEEGKGAVLQRLIQDTTPAQMRWITQIILKELKACRHNLSRHALCIRF